MQMPFFSFFCGASLARGERLSSRGFCREYNFAKVEETGNIIVKFALKGLRV